MKRFRWGLYIPAACILLVSCTSSRFTQASIARAATSLLKDSALATAHIGISVYDAGTAQPVYEYNSNKYFIPASNTKIATCYTAMKYLGDSLDGLLYAESDSQLTIMPTGDPTFLHGDFNNQPVITFLKQQAKPIAYVPTNWQETALGEGWSWDDYQDYYSAERSGFPLYGNTVTLTGSKVTTPSYFLNHVLDLTKNTGLPQRPIQRDLYSNSFVVTAYNLVNRNTYIPFITSDSLSVALLMDTLHRNIEIIQPAGAPQSHAWQVIKSQPTDSLLKIMMHRSDNFYAEQCLLMVSEAMLGCMKDERIIDTILRSDFKDIPQPPRWVDGSGLSRYNLFTPADLVWILKKMRSEFYWKRITTIFSTAGEGSLKSYPLSYKDKIFAKSGSLSNNLSLSGYLITRKNKLYIFSVMIGNHMNDDAAIRKSIETLLTHIMETN